jgi:hypothetical protein
MRRLLMVLIAAGMCGCNMVPETTSLDKIDKSAVASCGAGFDQNTNASLEAALERNGGKITSGFSQQARTAIFDDPSFTGADKQKAYDSYLKCISDSRGQKS